MTPQEKMPLLPRSPRMDNLDQVLKQPPSPRRVEEIKKADKVAYENLKDEKRPISENKERRYTL